jgi:lipocalin
MNKTTKQLYTQIFVVLAFVAVIMIFVTAPENDLEIQLITDSEIDLTTTETFDINEYLGVWYEIARYENPYQKGCKCSKQELYIDDDAVKAINTCNKEEKRSEARLTFYPTNIPGLLEGNIFFTTTQYRVLYTNYETTLVTNKDGTQLWIMSREKTMNQRELDQIKEIMTERGLDTNKLTYQGCTS